MRTRGRAMARLSSWLSADVMHALGWALIHSLWQCLGLAALAAVLMAFSRRPSVRYLVATGTLVAVLAAPIATFLVLVKQAAPAHALFSASFRPQLFAVGVNPPNTISLAPGAASTTRSNSAKIALADSGSICFRRACLTFFRRTSCPGWWAHGFAAWRCSVCVWPEPFCFSNISAADNSALPALAFLPYARNCSVNSASTAPSGIWNAAGLRLPR